MGFATRLGLGTVLMAAIILAACSTQPAATPTVEPTTAPPPTPTTAPTATAVPSPTSGPPTTVLFNYSRAVRYLEAGFYEDAIPAFSLVIRQLPDFAEGYRGRGVAQFHEGRLETALEDFNQAIALNDGYADAYKDRAVLYVERGDTELAIADLEMAVSLYDPGRQTAKLDEATSLLEGLQ